MSTSRRVIVGQTINLDIKVFNALGDLVDADSTPSVEIKDGDGLIIRPSSPSGVVRLGTGLYRLTYTVSSSATSGIWVDTWRVAVDGNLVTDAFNFIVLTASASIDVSGSQIGDAPAQEFSQDEICGINVLMEQLRCRLKNNAKAEVLDAYGIPTLEDCPIFTNDELLCFLQNSLSEFNQTPHFTAFTFAEQIIWERNSHILVEGAFILAAAAQMLIEAGREFTISDNGITMQPPPLSTTLNNALSAFVTRHTEMLKFIKANMKPAPRGVGTFRVLAVSPAFLRLRHLRQRQIV